MFFAIAVFRSRAYRRTFACIIFYAGCFLGLSGSIAAQEIAILKSSGISAYSEAISAFKADLPPSFLVIQEYNLQG